MFEIIATVCTLTAGIVTIDCTTFNYSAKKFETEEACEDALVSNRFIMYGLTQKLYEAGRHNTVIDKVECLQKEELSS